MKNEHAVETRRVLVAGWFSFEQMGATAGDLIACGLVCKWLEDSAVPYQVAYAAPFSGGVHWNEVDEKDFTDVVFVCGPFGNGWPVTEFLAKFSGSRIVGLNLSMLQPLHVWNPFDLLLERDSDETARPDITFLGRPPGVPVVGVILAHKQLEYGEKSLHQLANAAIERLFENREAAIVRIDTSLEENQGGLRTYGEIESLIAKMDVVVTTRLHGTVLALKNGVPVIPIDPVAGGAKISLQVGTLGWPLLFVADNLQEDGLSKAFEFCLSQDARELARQTGLKAAERVEQVRRAFVSWISGKSELAKQYD